MIHLISGKGGVGKSTLAAALAWRLAGEGRKTLLIEFGERSYFRHIFQSDIGPNPLSVTSHLQVVRWDGEACLRDYLRYFIKIDRIVRLFFDNKVMQALIQAAPALREMALLGKLTSGTRRIGPSLPYDELVVDAYATGHFRALWRAPIGLAAAIPFGPMGEQSRAIVETLRNEDRTRFYVAMIPEELPVSEGLELARDIQSEMLQKPKLLFNRQLSVPLKESEVAQFRGHEFAEYLLVLLERQKRLLLQAEKSGWQLNTLPWLFTSNMQEKIRLLAASLELA